MKDHGQCAALARLLATFETKDPDEVEEALAGIELSEGDPAVGAALMRLLEARWHMRHEEAHAALERLARSDTPEVAAYALKRLHCWNDELSRKGKPETG